MPLGPHDEAVFRELDELTAAGWGDVPQTQILANWRDLTPPKRPPKPMPQETPVRQAILDPADVERLRRHVKLLNPRAKSEDWFARRKEASERFRADLSPLRRSAGCGKITLGGVSSTRRPASGAVPPHRAHRPSLEGDVKIPFRGAN